MYETVLTIVVVGNIGAMFYPDFVLIIVSCNIEVEDPA